MEIINLVIITQQGPVARSLVSAKVSKPIVSMVFYAG